MGNAPSSLEIHPSWNDVEEVLNLDSPPEIQVKNNAMTAMWDQKTLSKERLESLLVVGRTPEIQERLKKRSLAMTIILATQEKLPGFFSYKQLLGLGLAKCLSLWGETYSAPGVNICEEGMAILDNTVVSLNYESNVNFITEHEDFPSLFTPMTYNKSDPDWLKTFTKKVQLSGSVVFLMTDEEFVSIPCIEERKAVLSLQRPVAVYFAFKYGDSWVLRLSISYGGILVLANVPPCLSTELKVLNDHNVHEIVEEIENAEDDDDDDDDNGEGQMTSLHKHPLTDTPSGRSRVYVCDSCDDRGSVAYCRKCDFDLCESCFEENKI